ncbi:hypothetical protein [Arthrobacter sp. S41]|uniref:hypothetical protein n=1 Tax=Arthrobacter sp. S41 TaxID=2509721 RepID=UPI001035A972|nr:hypothetical protein [Arthrobacter sp. S41]TAP25803.1 hypothetical protein EYR88_12650 [Arthrobacter sp. S41]
MKLPLHERERVVIKTREHSRVLRQPITAFLILTALCTFALGYLSREDLSDWLANNANVWMIVSVVLWAALVLIWVLLPWIRWTRSLVVLTTERIMFRSTYSQGKLQSVGLFTVRDLVAYAKSNNAMTRAGTLDIVMNQGYVRISHVPAVGYFRSLAVETMTNLRNNPGAAHTETTNSEGTGA